MTSPLTGDGIFAAISCIGLGDDWTLYVPALYDRDFPFSDVDEGLTMRFRADDAEWAFETARYLALSNSRGVASVGGSINVIEIMGVLSLGAAAIAVEIGHPASGRSATYSLPVDDVAPASAGTFGGCFDAASQAWL
jgi:hypothetical protein